MWWPLGYSCSTQTLITFLGQHRYTTHAGCYVPWMSGSSACDRDYYCCCNHIRSEQSGVSYDMMRYRYGMDTMHVKTIVFGSSAREQAVDSYRMYQVSILSIAVPSYDHRERTPPARSKTQEQLFADEGWMYWPLLRTVGTNYLKLEKKKKSVQCCSKRVDAVMYPNMNRVYIHYKFYSLLVYKRS